MLKTVWAVVRDGRIELLDKTAAPEGTRVLVTLLLEDEADFWLQASSASLNKVWDNLGQRGGRSVCRTTRSVTSYSCVIHSQT